MKLNVEAMMVEYGDCGYSCFEVPEFVDDESMLIFYRPDMLRNNDVVDVLNDIMDDALSSNTNEIEWVISGKKIEAYDFFIDGNDARCISGEVLCDNGWNCFLYIVVAIDDDTKTKFTFADMFDAARIELIELGLID